MTPPELPRVTVVLPTASTMEDEHLMRAVYSVEQQDYPANKVDFHIVFDTDEFGLDLMRQAGVKAADTDWVAFMADTDEWDREYLRGLVTRVLDMNAVATWRKTSDAVPLISLKSIWLEGLK